MAETLTIDFDKPFPLFPLTNCALLPHATIPLHIFEPRYLAMIHDALDSRGLIAMATYQSAPREPSDQPHPALRPIVCLGLIVRHQHLDDGRYHILLQGICRARIEREIDHEPYRLAILRPIDVSDEQHSPMEIDLIDQRQRLESLIHDSTLRELAAVNAIHHWLSDEIPTAVVVDLTILTLCSNVDQRYAMLAEPDVERRANWLDHHLRQTRDTLETANSFGPSLSDDGLSLN